MIVGGRRITIMVMRSMQAEVSAKDGEDPFWLDVSASGDQSPSQEMPMRLIVL
jgi:hypothetical protein